MLPAGAIMPDHSAPAYERMLAEMKMRLLDRASALPRVSHDKPHLLRGPRGVQRAVGDDLE